MRLAVDQEHFAHHQFVRCTTQWVVAHEDRLEDTVGPIAGRLLGARTIEAPDWRLLTNGHYLALGPQLVHGFGAVHPDVLGLVVVVLLWQRCLLWKRLPPIIGVSLAPPLLPGPPPESDCAGSRTL